MTDTPDALDAVILLQRELDSANARAETAEKRLAAIYNLTLVHFSPDESPVVADIRAIARGDTP